MIFNIALEADCDRPATLSAIRELGTVTELDAMPRILILDAPDETVLASLYAIPGVSSANIDKPMKIDGDHLVVTGVPTAAGQWPLVMHGRKAGAPIFDSVFALHKKGHAAKFNYDPTTAPGDGSGVNIYIVDSGVQGTHEEFGVRFINTIYNAYPSAPLTGYGSHGTWCASSAAGLNFGVAPGANIYSARAFDDSGTTATSTIVSAINACLSHYNGQSLPGVVSMSFSGWDSSDYSAAVIGSCVDAGLVPVCSSGNDGLDLTTTGLNDRWPAENPDAITVGGLDEQMRLHPSANYGGQTDIYASFHAWTLAQAGGGDDAYRIHDIRGTSFSCPMVAGMIARMLTGSAKLANRAAVEALKADLLANYAVEDVLDFDDAPLTGAKRLWVPGITFVGFEPFTRPTYEIPPALPIILDHARTYAVFGFQPDRVSVRHARTYAIIDTIA